MASLLSPKAILGALIPVLLAALIGPQLLSQLSVLGVFRQPGVTIFANPEDIVFIEDTTQCEDVHYYARTNTLFAACEAEPSARFSWFPPLTNFDDPVKAQNSRGSIHVIDPDTKKSQRLEFENFDGTFVTHGIDVIPDPKSGEDDAAVYIFAVNHVPSPEYVELKQQADPDSTETPKEIRKSNSRIEVFHHRLGSSSVRYVRTVQHPLLSTPNDIFALSSTEFYVTNDHHYLEGPLRLVEDVVPAAGWTNTIHVRYSEEPSDDQSDVVATVALSGLHNNNGLSHGRTSDEVFVASAMSGRLHVSQLSKETQEGVRPISISETVPFESAIDNPSYFTDPFANETFDASGVVIAGLGKAAHIPRTTRDPEGKESVIVWYAKPGKPTPTEDGTPGTPGSWEKRVLFEDDGERIRTASAAVLVAIDPTTEGGARKGWLFVTGFFSRNMVAVKVDL